MHNLKNLKHIFAIWAIIVVLIFGVMRILGADFLVPVTQFFVYRDAPFQNFIYRHEWKPSTDQIAIIAIDDNSLNALQATSQDTNNMLTIPKKVYIDLIEKLESVGVKGIAFDIIFQNRDPDEQVFADILQKHDNIVIGTTARCIPNKQITENSTSAVDSVFKDIKESYIECEGSLDDTETAEFYKDMEGKDFKYSLPYCYKDNDTDIYTCDGFPRSIYMGANWGLLQIDSQIYKRKKAIELLRAPFLTSGETRYIPSMSEKLYTLTHSGYSVSENQYGDMIQPFFGGVGTYPTFTFTSILSGSKLDLVKTLAGKYVFIGDTSQTNHDRVYSPVIGVQIPGVDTHAHLFDGFLQNRIPSEISAEKIAILILILSLIFTLAYFFLPRYISPIIAVFMLIFSIWIGRYLYNSHSIVFDIFPVILAMSLLSFPITFIYRFFIVDREKRKMQKDFGHYVDPRVVAEISEKGQEIELGGERRPMTVMFSDIAGFTTISEKLAPNDLFFLMTSYLSNMTDILIEQGGTLDKYIGDAVMGFFGAPLPVSDHPLRACRTALLMREKLPEFNAGITKHGIDAIDFRVGIATGDDVMVGNIGSKERFNYTVLGDTVNLASRLEGTGKEYGVHIIIAHPTREAIGDAYIVRELDTIAVKGKTEGVRIYELIGTREQATNLYAYEQYEKALTLYRAGNYRDAGIMWEKQKDIDPPSRIMMERCLELIKNGTTLENGVYHMTHK